MKRIYSVDEYLTVIKDLGFEFTGIDVASNKPSFKKGKDVILFCKPCMWIKYNGARIRFGKEMNEFLNKLITENERAIELQQPIIRTIPGIGNNLQSEKDN